MAAAIIIMMITVIVAFLVGFILTVLTLVVGSLLIGRVVVLLFNRVDDVLRERVKAVMAVVLEANSNQSMISANVGTPSFRQRGKKTCSRTHLLPGNTSSNSTVLYLDLMMLMHTSSLFRLIQPFTFIFLAWQFSFVAGHDIGVSVA